MSLTEKTPGNSYKDLLQMDNGNVGIDGTLRTVKDGEGTTCPLQLSSSDVAVTSTPTSSNHVATKGYVDTTTTANPIYVAVAGSTMTGALTLNANPTNNLHAATKQYVDAVIESGSLPTSSQFLELTSGLSTRMTLYLINVRPATNNATLRVHVNIDSIGWVTTGSDYTYVATYRNSGGNASVTGSTTNTSQIQISSGLRNTTGSVGAFKIEVFNLSPFYINVEGQYINDSGNIEALESHNGRYKGSGTVIGFRVGWSSGNFAEGTYTLVRNR